jgi:ABC-type nitrate/sulfonate/bicarbonate transport system permease component
MSDAAIVARRSILRKPPPLLARLGVLACLLALWEAAASAGLVNAFIAPPPSAIFASFEMLFVQEGLVNAFVRTFAEALAAAAIGSVIGIVAGYWLHRSKLAGLAYTDWVAAMASAPLVLLYPLFLVIFGRNSATIVAMGVVGCLPPIILKAKEGLDGVRPVLLNVGRAYGLSRWAMFSMIQFPAALPTIFSGVRIGLLFAIINVVGVEYLIVFGGLGQMISDLGDRFEIPGMYAGILFVVLVSICFFFITEKIEKWLLSSK